MILMKNILYAILASFILSQDVLGMSMVRNALGRSSPSLSDNSIQPLDNPTNGIDNIIENIENMLHDIEKIKQYPDNTILIDENLKKSGLSINTETIRDFNDNRFLGINDFKGRADTVINCFLELRVFEGMCHISESY